MYIYKTINLINGKIYIGKKILKPEKSQKYFGSGIALNKAIKKYGIENFKKEILEDNIQDREILKEKEKFYINLYNSTNQSIGYNLTLGGDDGRLPGFKHSEETKKKIGEKSKLKVYDEEYRKKLSISGKKLKGRPSKLKGIPKSKEHIEKLIEANRKRAGIPLSEETKQKIREGIGDKRKGENNSNYNKIDLEWLKDKCIYYLDFHIKNNLEKILIY